jgi:hypothetical protein
VGLLSRAARVALRDLEELDPINWAIPWQTKGVSISDELVRKLARTGRVTRTPFNDRNGQSVFPTGDWDGYDHARRIAALMNDGWDDPIRLGLDEHGSPYMIDGYHRLAAARLRGDQDIPYWVDF